MGKTMDFYEMSVCVTRKISRFFCNRVSFFFMFFMFKHVNVLTITNG